MIKIRTVDVPVTCTVKVDVDAWAREFGVEPTPEAVREDVQTYFRTVVAGQLSSIFPDI